METSKKDEKSKNQSVNQHGFQDQRLPKHELRIFGYSLTTLILLALFLGALVGVLEKPFSDISWVNRVFKDGIFYVGGEIFFNLLKMLVVPVVFISLTCGVGALQDIRVMGRIGGRTLLLYVATTAFAIAMALLTSNIVNPGTHFHLTTSSDFQSKDAPSLVDVVIGFFPSNPIQAMLEANMLQVIILSLLFGISLSLAGEPGKRILKFFNDLNDVVMKLVEIVMLIAPIGVFCLIARVFSSQGFDAIKPLSLYFFTVLAGLILHALIAYGGLLVFFAKLNPQKFYKKFKKVMVFAFSTSSSNATLPVTMDVVENEIGVHRKVASFTLPLGATINMDGTAIMQGVATVFIAQAYGIDIGFYGYLMVILTATLASIGTAGVPGVGLVMLAMVLKQVHLPVEGIGLIIGVDRLLDMSRTAVNITGDAVVTCLVAKKEKLLDEDVYNS